MFFTLLETSEKTDYRGEKCQVKYTITFKSYELKGFKQLKMIKSALLGHSEVIIPRFLSIKSHLQ